VALTNERHKQEKQMLCTMCKKREATTKIYGKPLCDRCSLVFKAGMVVLSIGFVEKALDEATEKIKEGGEDDRRS